MKEELKRYLDENAIVAMWDADPDNPGEIVYICGECISEEDFPEDWNSPFELRLRTEKDLREDEVFVGISQFRPVRCSRCGKQILEGCCFAQFRQVLTVSDA